MIFVGTTRDLDQLIRATRDRLKAVVLGYRFSSGRVEWGEIGGLEDLPLGVEDSVKPGYYRLVRGGFFRHSHVSPKNYLHPPQQHLVAETIDFKVYPLPGETLPKAVFFGIKPCDLKAISILDSVLFGKHPVYTARRGSVTAVVVEECLEPNENCFCGAVGAGPVANDGFDVAYARLDPETVVLRAGSSTGSELIANLGLERADQATISRYKEAVSRALEKTRSRLYLGERYQEMLLKSASREDLWDKLSERCLGCGNCNYVCPTCFCTELEYPVSSGVAVKLAKWTGCLLYSYGLVAGGHFRPRLFMRYRHFVLHKFVFYEKQVGRTGCVGCGRCITWCPVGLDLRVAVRNALTGVGFERG